MESTLRGRSSAPGGNQRRTIGERVSSVHRAPGRDHEVHRCFDPKSTFSGRSGSIRSREGCRRESGSGVPGENFRRTPGQPTLTRASPVPFNRQNGTSHCTGRSPGQSRCKGAQPAGFFCSNQRARSTEALPPPHAARGGHELVTLPNQNHAPPVGMGRRRACRATPSPSVPRGPRSYSPEERRALLSERARSGETMAAFWARPRVSTATICAWTRTARCGRSREFSADCAQGRKSSARASVVLRAMPPAAGSR